MLDFVRRLSSRFHIYNISSQNYSKRVGVFLRPKSSFIVDRSLSSVVPLWVIRTTKWNQYHLNLFIDQTVRSRSSDTGDQSLSDIEYDDIAEETLESLTEYFDELVEESDLEDTDVTYSNGVLTVNLSQHGIYVINKQSPNKQIWLSSPTSGPKRYDFISGTWIYKHDGVPLYQLLNDEMKPILELPNIDFKTNCSYGTAKT